MAILSYTMLSYAMLSYAMLSYAMLCYAMLSYAMLYLLLIDIKFTTYYIMMGIEVMMYCILCTLTILVCHVMIGKTHPYSNIFIDMGANYGSSIEGAQKKGSSMHNE